MEKPWAETIYRPAAALEFFKAAGKPEKAPAGTAFFAENEKARPYFFMRDKMYLLLDGSVDLVARRKVIGSVAQGPDLRRDGLDHARAAQRERGGEDRLQGDRARRQAVPRRPAEEARLRADADEHHDRRGCARPSPGWPSRPRCAATRCVKESVVFDPKRLAELADGLSNEPPVYFDRGKTIVQEGQPGLRMYAVIEGRVAVSIGGGVVERLGPGGVFGELALVEQTPRMASVVAETDCRCCRSTAPRSCCW